MIAVIHDVNLDARRHDDNSRGGHDWDFGVIYSERIARFEGGT